MTAPGDEAGRLSAQFAFLNEADKLKQVLRATTLCDGSRAENSGEHSWHLALYALVLADQAGPGVNIDRVVRMLLLHDLVEIDTGDVPIHSAGGQAHGSAEVQAADALRRDAVDILLRRDRRYHGQAIDVMRQRKQHQDAVDGLVFVEPLNLVDDTRSGS